jgi:hypothetical protein
MAKLTTQSARTWSTAVWGRAFALKLAVAIDFCVAKLPGTTSEKELFRQLKYVSAVQAANEGKVPLKLFPPQLKYVSAVQAANEGKVPLKLFPLQLISLSAVQAAKLGSAPLKLLA